MQTWQTRDDILPTVSRNHYIEMATIALMGKIYPEREGEKLPEMDRVSESGS